MNFFQGLEANLSLLMLLLLSNFLPPLMVEMLGLDGVVSSTIITRSSATAAGTDEQCVSPISAAKKKSYYPTRYLIASYIVF